MNDFNEWVFNKSGKEIVLPEGETIEKEYWEKMKPTFEILMKAMWEINRGYDLKGQLIMDGDGVHIAYNDGDVIYFDLEKPSSEIETLEDALKYIFNNEDKI